VNPERVRFFTPGVWVVAAIAAVGLAALLYRFLFGLGAATNLSNDYPWGIWIAIDVACGVALAAGGFTTAFIAHIVHRDVFHPLVRPALLTAMIGYTFVAIGVSTDLGRFWAIWHVMLPPMWQGNSVLFEVAICVMCYLTVLYIEFLPIVCERFIGRVNLPGPLARLNDGVDRGLRLLDKGLAKTMTMFIILGVLLSCMHQSSLGTLMVITAGKLHPLWQTPMLPMMFLLSAFAVGLSMVVFEALLASRSLRLKPETDILGKLSAYIPMLLGVYFAAKLIDLLNRGALGAVFEGSTASNLFILEVGLGVIVPFFILTNAKRRESARWLFAAATLVIFGVVMNRLNVFLIGYTPTGGYSSYFPSLAEIAVTAGFIALIVLIYRFVVFNFPVIEHFKEHQA
jgi:Ni/Fe-hydrogenase subunit HybB-like protein